MIKSRDEMGSACMGEMRNCIHNLGWENLIGRAHSETPIQLRGEY
jgi:hypothetical protein